MLYVNRKDKWKKNLLESADEKPYKSLLKSFVMNDTKKRLKYKTEKESKKWGENQSQRFVLR